MLRIHKNQLRSVQIYEFGSHYVQQNSILGAKPPPTSQKVVYTPGVLMFKREACQLLQWIPIWQCVWLHMKNQSTCSYVLKMTSTARTSWWALRSGRAFVSAQTSSSYHWGGERNCITHGLGDSEWMKLIEKISEWLRNIRVIKKISEWSRTYQRDREDIRVIENISEWSRRYQSDWEYIRVIKMISEWLRRYQSDREYIRVIEKMSVIGKIDDHTIPIAHMQQLWIQSKEFNT